MVVVCFSLFSCISLAVRCEMLGAMPPLPHPAPRHLAAVTMGGKRGMRGCSAPRGSVPPGWGWGGSPPGAVPSRQSLGPPRRERSAPFLSVRPLLAAPPPGPALRRGAGKLAANLRPPGMRAAPTQLRVRRPRPRAGGMRCRGGGWGGGGLVSVRAPSCINIWLYPAVRCELGARPAGYKYAQASCSPLGALRRGGREGTGGSGQGRTGRSARTEASERNEIGKCRKELF